MNSGYARTTGKEQYYTPAPLCDSIVVLVQSKIKDWQNRTWVEPAAGTGNFVIAEIENGVDPSKIIAIDLYPKQQFRLVKIRKADFLDDAVQLKVKNAITLTNPPFGRNNSLCVPFFNKSAKFSDYICVIVPRSWRKWTVIDKLDPDFHCILDEDIEVNYENEHGEPYSGKILNTVFQIWQRRTSKRKRLNVVEDRGYLKKVPSTDADVRIRQCGFNLGKVETDFDKDYNHSNFYFFKLKNKKVLKALNEVDFSRFAKNSSHRESLSMKEINYLLNEWFDKNG